MQAPQNQGARRKLLSPILLLVSIVECGTPTAVKNLSAEEVKAQLSYAGTLRAYFEVISKFVDAQVQANL
jgi:hypothetical protein